jgi:phenylacetate-CoA ligase
MEIFNYHRINSPFYKEYTSIVNSVIWENITILTKKGMRNPINEIISQEFKINQLRISSTSGSTGTPFFFAKDKFSHAITWALIND